MLEAGSEKQEVLPETSGAPQLFSSLRVDSYERRKSMSRRRKCFPLPMNISAWVQSQAALTDFPLPKASLAKKVGAEFVGTFILIFAAAGGPVMNQKYNGAETLIGNAACSGLAVMIVVLSIGHISGAHLNPAVTLAFATFRHFPWLHVPPYLIAQILASICASFTLKAAFHPFISAAVTAPSIAQTHAFFLEFIITFTLMFVITSVATDTRAVGELAGIAIGGAVLLNILVAGPSTGASMNPVRSLGPAIAAQNYRSIWIYFVAPVLGALVGAGVYGAIKLSEDEADPNRLTISLPH